jgi:hypothetical protein
MAIGMSAARGTLMTVTDNEPEQQRFSGADQRYKVAVIHTVVPIVEQLLAPSRASNSG